jgi:hypothetical protein
LSDFIDADDRMFIVRIGVYLLGLAAILISMAATLGLAWTVFRIAGGL